MTYKVFIYQLWPHYMRAVVQLLSYLKETTKDQMVTTLRFHLSKEGVSSVYFGKLGNRNLNDVVQIQLLITGTKDN